MFPRPFLNIPAETNRVVQVKYTNPHNLTVMHCLLSSAWGRPTSAARVPGWKAGKYAFGSEERSPLVTSWAVAIDLITSAALVVCGQTHSSSRIGGSANIKSFFFWIKSSARRAFGECLGSKRR